ncbi:MAG: HAMP domain-containing histidine kinase [Planctomycetes bacterium]|nr:HAMP domain-containing histidine kinase [Planctomycetota bacterium]
MSDSVASGSAAAGLRRAMLLYILGAVGPTVGLAAWGYGAVAREGARLVGERRAELDRFAGAAASDVDALLAEQERVENDRHFTEYFFFQNDLDLMTSNTALRMSPLNGLPEGGIVRGYFQVAPNVEVLTPHWEERNPGANDGLEQAGSRVALLEEFREATPAILGLLGIPGAGGSVENPLQPAPGPGAQAGQVGIEEGGVRNLAGRGDRGGKVWEAREDSWAATQNSYQSYLSLAQEDRSSQQRAQTLEPPEHEEGQELNPQGVMPHPTDPAPESRVVRFQSSPFRTVLVGTGSAARAYVCRILEAVDGQWVQGYALDLDALTERLVLRRADEARDVKASLFLAGDGSLGEDVHRARIGDRLPTWAVEVRDLDAGAVAARVETLQRRYLLWAGGVVGIVALCGGLLVRSLGAERDLARRKVDFLSSVTHELKTPLSAIRMYGEMLRDGWTDDPAKRARYLDHITRESERLSRLIHNVLDLSRVERNPTAVSMRLGPCDGVVREVVETMGPELERDGVRVTLAVDPGLPEIRFDADGLRQILVNLLDNARKYGRRPGSERADGSLDPVEVRLRRDGARVRLEVADQGVGVAPAERARIFEAFVRGASAGVAQGAGLGLAVASALARAMGTRLELSDASPRGGSPRGACFVLTFAA